MPGLVADQCPPEIFLVYVLPVHWQRRRCKHGCIVTALFFSSSSKRIANICSFSSISLETAEISASSSWYLSLVSFFFFNSKSI